MRNECFRFKRIWRGWIALLITVPLTSSATRDEFRELAQKFEASTFESAHIHAQAIARKCPPPDCLIISVGMTNVLIDSYLRRTPTSLAYWPFLDLRALASFTSEEQMRFFASTIPREQLAGLKRILFLRVLHASETMFVVMNSFSKYLDQVESQVKLEGYFPCWDPFDNNFECRLQRHTPASRFGNLHFIEDPEMVGFSALRNLVIGGSEPTHYKSPIEKYHFFKPIKLTRESLAFVGQLKYNELHLKLDALVNMSLEQSEVFANTVRSECRSYLR